MGQPARTQNPRIERNPIMADNQTTQDEDVAWGVKASGEPVDYNNKVLMARWEKLQKERAAQEAKADKSAAQS